MSLFRWFKKKEQKKAPACTCCCEQDPELQENPSEESEQVYGENITKLGLRIGQAPCPCSIRKDGRNNWEYQKRT